MRSEFKIQNYTVAGTELTAGGYPGESFFTFDRASSETASASDPPRIDYTVGSLQRIPLLCVAAEVEVLHRQPPERIVARPFRGGYKCT